MTVSISIESLSNLGGNLLKECPDYSEELKDISGLSQVVKDEVDIDKELCIPLPQKPRKLRDEKVLPKAQEAVIKLTLNKPYTVDSTVQYKYPFFDFGMKLYAGDVDSDDKDELDVLAASSSQELREVQGHVTHLTKTKLSGHVSEDYADEEVALHYEEGML